MKQICSINTYVINLRKRAGRRLSILSEFADKQEFRLTIIPTIEHSVGAFSFWPTMRDIILQAKEVSLDYILICSDDHIFTESYRKEVLFNAIEKAKDKNADILSGGVSWFDMTVQIDKNLFWVNKFNGCQFIVIFQKFYNRLLGVGFKQGDNVDYKISLLTDDIMVMYPFISVQKEFGRSDMTSKNETLGQVSGLFQNSEEKLRQLNGIAEFYELAFG